MYLRHAVMVGVTSVSLYLATALAGTACGPGSSPSANCSMPLVTSCASCLAPACGTTSSTLLSDCTTFDSCYLAQCATLTSPTPSALSMCTQHCFASATPALSPTTTTCLASNFTGSCAQACGATAATNGKCTYTVTGLPMGLSLPSSGNCGVGDVGQASPGLTVFTINGVPPGATGTGGNGSSRRRLRSPPRRARSLKARAPARPPRRTASARAVSFGPIRTHPRTHSDRAKGGWCTDLRRGSPADASAGRSAAIQPHVTRTLADRGRSRSRRSRRWPPVFTRCTGWRR